MAAYEKLYIAGNGTGLVQGRQDFLLPNDAYPVLVNAFIFREQLRRRQGLTRLGRFRRVFLGSALGNADGTGNFSGNIIAIFSLEVTSQIEKGSVVVRDGTHTFTDDSNGNLVGVPSGTGTINYSTSAITIAGATPGAALTIDFNYFPCLPVMGLRSRELPGINAEELIAFDTKYAYEFTVGWNEFIAGTTWNSSDSDFFWSTNYWVDTANNKIFWVTNGFNADPIRYTNGSFWVSFAPIINSNNDTLQKCLAMLPFRGRLVVFNTVEQDGKTAVQTQMRQRIRWAAIGTPFTAVGAITVSVNPKAWMDDIRGQGGFLDIPTSEDIVSVGFVRDNLVIYCERSTWQLRYTGRTIAPFQIERVNSELGAESTFSAVQFDTSLVGIGDKGVVECDSYKSERIDIKIPDLVFEFHNQSDGEKRVHGIRDFQQKLAYWTYPYNQDDGETITPYDVKFPNRRLVYNYENDSWAIFTDSLTTLGVFQSPSELRWNSPEIANTTWAEANFPWVSTPALFPSLVGGNQQGYVMFLGSNLEPQTVNDETLYISGILGQDPLPTKITSKDHNLETGSIIKITGIPTSAYATSLNNQIFYVDVIDQDTFYLKKYNAANGMFDIFQIDAVSTYLGGAEIIVKDNFSITSKKFNYIEDGQNIQLGFIDVLASQTDQGEISVYVYLDYNDNSPINIYPQNQDSSDVPDTFFNSVMPTTLDNTNNLPGSKYWHRVFCPARGAFITIEYTLSNLQMTTIAQESDVQLDAQILYMRRAGRQLPLGV